MMKNKKKTFVIGKPNESIGKPKELWKSYKVHLQQFVSKKAAFYRLTQKLILRS